MSKFPILVTMTGMLVLTLLGNLSGVAAQTPQSQHPEQYDPTRSGVPGQLVRDLPGIGETTIHYQELSGWAIFEGDILLGEIDELTADPPPDDELLITLGLVRAWSQLWEDGIVPYKI